MKRFEKPVIIDSFDITEGVFAASGYVPIIPPEEEVKDWDIQVKWCNHNSGSHSEMEVYAYNKSGKSGNYFAVELAFFGKGNIESVANASKATQTTFTAKSIRLVYNGHFNPGESMCFGLPDVRFSEGTGNGAYHTSQERDFCNAPAYDAFYVSSYTVG